MWNSPPETWLKLNFDVLAMMGFFDARGFLCNSIGKMVMAYSINYGGGPNNEAKAFALLGSGPYGGMILLV